MNMNGPSAVGPRLSADNQDPIAESPLFMCGADQTHGNCSSSKDVSQAVAARRRRITAPWRLALALYALALVTTTHWPNLRLGPQAPASDKIIHLLAFGTLTVLLWKTRWITRLTAAGLAVALWAVVDEYSQGIRILNRTVSLHDLIANCLGVAVALAWIWALQPVGAAGGPNRMRLKLASIVTDEMFATPPPWRALAIAALIGGVPLLVVCFILNAADNALPLLEFRRWGPRAAIVAGVVLAILATALQWRVIWRRQLAQVMQSKPCLECGNLPSAEGWRPRVSIWDISQMGALTKSRQTKAMLGVAIAIGIVVIIMLLPVMHSIIVSGAVGGGVEGGVGGPAGEARSGTWLAPGIARLIGTLGPEMSNTIDFAALMLLLAPCVRLYRQGLARHYDRLLAGASSCEISQVETDGRQPTVDGPRLV
jgi:VanZ family protein